MAAAEVLVSPAAAAENECRRPTLLTLLGAADLPAEMVLVPVNRLAKPQSYITEVAPNCNLSSGNQGICNVGVNRVVTPDGPMVMKVGFAKREPKILSGVLAVHRVFAEQGLAPAIRGVILPEEMADLGVRLGLKKDWERELGVIPKQGFVGYLMDEVPNPWNSKYPAKAGRDDERLKIMAGWDQEDIENQMIRITEQLTRLSIKAFDLQFLVSPEGRVYLIDFDHYERVADPAEAAAMNASFLRASLNNLADSLAEIR